MLFPFYVAVDLFSRAFTDVSQGMCYRFMVVASRENELFSLCFVIMIVIKNQKIDKPF